MINGSDKSSIKFANNIARIVGNSIYQNVAVADLYNRSCLTDRVVGISTKFIATLPKEANFYDSAIVIDNDNGKQCNMYSYYVQNLMFGNDIVIPACVIDHYNHSSQHNYWCRVNLTNTTVTVVQSRFNRLQQYI